MKIECIKKESEDSLLKQAFVRLLFIRLRSLSQIKFNFLKSSLKFFLSILI